MLLAIPEYFARSLFRPLRRYIYPTSNLLLTTLLALVFRDGHSEEVHDYTIADGILYTRGDFYTDGYWNKKIELSALDIPQTLAANAARDVKFVLPSSPNEVIASF